MNHRRFALGQILMTPAALTAFAESNEVPIGYLARHASCDWGIVNGEDAELNDQSLIDGSRLLSAYQLKNETKIWIITEAVGEEGVREVTTILLPEDY